MTRVSRRQGARRVVIWLEPTGRSGDQFDHRTCGEKAGVCVHALDGGRYVIDGGVERAHKQYEQRSFNGYSFCVFAIMRRSADG